MSDVTAKAVAALNERIEGGFDGVARFDIEDEGSIIIDGNGAREGDDEADVTLSADAETFEQILSGDLDPTAAFMGGRLKVDGDMGAAMRLAAVLA